MKRRHLIVHGADRTEPLNSGKRIVLDIKCSDVTKWLLAIIEFASEVLPQIGIKQINGIRMEGDSFQLETKRNYRKRRTTLKKVLREKGAIDVPTYLNRDEMLLRNTAR